MTTQCGETREIKHAFSIFSTFDRGSNFLTHKVSLQFSSVQRGNYESLETISASQLLSRVASIEVTFREFRSSVPSGIDTIKGAK
jgi:hypothetical protein